MTTMYKIYIAKLDQEIEVDWSALPDNSAEYFKVYGMTQSLNDAAASVSKDEIDADPAAYDKALALIQKRLAKIYDGEVPEAGARGVGSVMRIAMDKAIEYRVRDEFKKAGKKLSDKKALDAAARKAVDANPMYLDLARKEIERRKAIAAEEAEWLKAQQNALVPADIAAELTPAT